MDYLPHQIEKSDLVLSKVRAYGFAILAMEERTGKTGTFIRAVELSSARSALVVTKKAAIAGIEEQITAFGAKRSYTVINYQSLHKLPSNFSADVVILDEFHQGVCSYPKSSMTFKQLKPLCKGRAIIYVSATPFAESWSQSYHALKLSSWTPFPHKNFYAWHKEYGVECEIYMHGRHIKQYHLTQESRIKSILSPMMIAGTRKEVGFRHEPQDVLHHIALDEKTKTRIACIKKDKIIEELDIAADTPSRELNIVYQLSGGGIDDIRLSSEKIDYIRSNFDPGKTAIMAHYISEQERLKEIFPNVFSATAHAEGVDLSHFSDLVIYSQNFSTAKHSQRRARQANISRDEPIRVHFLIAEDPAIDRHVYETVARKQRNFTSRIYTRSLFD